jgi:proton-dependent oligopeptide transporter, POT family
MRELADKTPGRGMQSQHDTRFFGHPRGLATLFFTEMWERFSYYGMRALLILFMTASAETGGLGFDVASAGAVYGLYTAMVWVLALPGGWLADRVFGTRRAVLYGGIVIALGHYAMAVHSLAFFYSGLALVSVGTGLLKPNVSALVGQLYPPGDSRRDAGFSIFYMGINLGAFIAPLVCGYVGQRIDWHYGFGLAGIGMTLGVVQYALGQRHLGTAGTRPAVEKTAAEQRGLRLALTAGAAGVGLVIALAAAGIVTARGIADATGFLLIALVVSFFGWMFSSSSWSAPERKRLTAVAVLFVASTIFWSAFEQAGSTLNLFAARNTETRVFGFDFPASWLQSVNALFIIALAPVFAWLWVKLGSREPSSPSKFAWGLFFAGLGFAILAVGAALAAGGERVSPMWLVATYLCHTIGELCLSPVGLSAMTKLAPERVGGLMMGVWFLSTGAGNYIGGRVASLYETFSLPALLSSVTVYTMGAALLLWLAAKPVVRLMSGVK